MMKKVVKIAACLILVLAVVVLAVHNDTKADKQTCQDMHVMEESLITPTSTEKEKNE